MVPVPWPDGSSQLAKPGSQVEITQPPPAQLTTLTLGRSLSAVTLNAFFRNALSSCEV